MSAKTAFFVVTGEALTEIARDLLLSEEPGRAYRVLADGLRGEGAIEAALKVLAGTHELAGDSAVGLELVEARDSEELRSFRKTFRYIYAGRYRDGRCWRRPVAWVAGYGPEDGQWATQQLGDCPSDLSESRAGLQRWWMTRARYYCRPGEEPVHLEMEEHGRVFVVTEPCGELPHWMRPNLTAQDALVDALAAERRLEKRMPPQLRAAEDRDAKRQKLLASIGARVRKKAGKDVFSLVLADGRVLTVPRAPFARWALARTPQRDSAPPWEPVSPVGLKLDLDDPNHTDWVLGAGLTLEEAYSNVVNEAAWNAAFDLQEAARAPEHKEPRRFEGIFASIEKLQRLIHDAAVVVDAGERTGVVGVDIAVFPDAQGARVEELGACRGVIVEQGGPLAHLVVVSKGRGDVTIMRHPDACSLFPPGTRVALTPATGRIVLVEEES